MRVAVFNGAGKPVTIEDRADPELGAGDVRINITRCGICGSDVSMTSGSPFDYEAGRGFGHEFGGEVIEVGKDVTGLKVGDRIACLPNGACGECQMCLEGRPLFCPQATPLFGGFGERMVLPANVGFMLPPSLSDADGALVEPMACGRKALRVAGFTRGDRVLVIGAGNMALAVIYWARLMGAGRIVVATRSAKRDDIALSLGADAAVRLDDEDPQAIERALGGQPDIVAECVGKPGMIQLAIEKAKLGGSVIAMGMCSAPDTIVPAFGTFREVSVHFPLAYGFEDFIETVRAFDAGRVKPDIMISRTIALDELGTILDEMRGPNEHLKVQVDPHLHCEH
ncbi:MAG: alcohol dehydrogenase catalytic domain-containing protein [Novosphingobium sp.]|nr:alcohol dehydrogenase catalytic domain-containing protein [Novosphingobium sp.]